MSNQRSRVLQILKQAGNNGVNQKSFNRTHNLPRAAARVEELRDMGYTILTKTEPDKTATYIFVGGSRMPVEAPVKEELVEVTYTKDGYDYLRLIPRSQLNRQEGLL